jgi:hypothetical protein
MSHMSVLGAFWKQDKEERKGILGKKACTREEIVGRKNNTHMHGRLNDARVRVFAMYCNGWQARNV